MKERFYGKLQQTVADGDLARHVEEIVLKGFTVVPDLFSDTELAQWRRKIDAVYEAQEKDFGRHNLELMQEEDVCRAPLLHDFSFLELAMHPRILAIVQAFLGDWYILNLQNAVINRPEKPHHQGAWHRDLPHQNFVISRPLAINALLAIDEFSEKTGGTQLLPFSHKREDLPSDAYIRTNQLSVTAKPGSGIVFDTMVFHRAGANASPSIRRAVNHLYTAPIIKQQYDLPRALGERAGMAPAAAKLLGYTCQVPLDDRQWRRARLARFSAAD